MNPLVKLPRFDPFDFRHTYTDAHAESIALADTPEKRAALNEAFQVASKAEEKRIKGERAKVAAANAAAFLADPVGVIALLDEERGHSFYLGEMILYYGIANVSSKRNGRGTFMHKGTLAAGIISPRLVTVKIGDITRVVESCARNDRRSIAEDESSTVAQVASEIAAGKLGN